MAEELEATLSTVRQETAFLTKYFDLRKRCEQMQQANEKMVNRLQHVKKIIKRHKREKKYLEARLVEYGDNYKESQVPVSWEEDQLFNCLRQNEPPPYPKASQDEDTSTGDNVAKMSADKSSALSTIQPFLEAYKKDGGPAKSRKVKSEKEKDPNAPKKPVNVFQLFCQEQKPVIQTLYFQENKEDIAHHELTRRLAHKWHMMSQEDKQVYYDLHEQENQKYRQEMQVYENKSEVLNKPLDILSQTSEANLAALHLPSQLSVKQEVD
ncbi:hypothetical protein SNE40_023085 [Patella caerulea]|uniref:HMG box domain-containing protein n=1 Tax=Patella caerulea TaxID=87958 RepID=A0AAN8G242_PATCE